MTSAHGPVPTLLTSEPGTRPVDHAVIAARRVIGALVHSDRGTADLAEVTEQLDRIADHLEVHGMPERVRRSESWAGATQGRHDPATGAENALAPPMAIHGLEDGSVRGNVILGLPYQGPDGHAHGGIIALLLDHLLGLAGLWQDKPGMTAQLDIRYHRRTPLFEQLELGARHVLTEGRKMRAVGEVRNAAGEVCVTAEGLFISRSETS